MQKRLHWQVFWCFCRRTFEMLWWKCKDEGRKERMRAAAFLDVCRCDSLKEAHDDQRRWWSACLRWKLVCGDEETSFEHNLLCVQYKHLHSRQLCTYAQMCEKCANDETEYDYKCICAGMTRGFSSRSSVLVICHHFVSQSFHTAQRFSK